MGTVVAKIVGYGADYPNYGLGQYGVLNRSYSEYYDSGQLKYKMSYKDGLIDGLYQEWYENGQLEMEETWVAGKPVGQYKKWDEKGNVSHGDRSFPIED